MTFWQFTIAALACYRATVLVARDAGPWDVFKRLRKMTRLSKLLSCPYCVSVWIAAIIEAGFVLSGVRDIPVVSVAIVFAMSAVSIILDRCFSADHQT